MKRFQECNRVIQGWRYRHYLAVPFVWCWHSFVSLKVYRYDDLTKYDIIKGRNLWKLLVGSAQCKMNWVYTMEEVKEKLKKFEL